MTASVEIDRASRRKMEQTLEKFAAVTGKRVEDGIEDVARSAARKLAHTVQPYGLSKSKGDKFQKSIGTQVDRAWFGTNLGAFPATTDMREAHYQARRHGVVPKRLFRKEKGKPWLGLIPVTERDAYKVKAQAKAGRAKGAWVQAANDIGGPKMSGVAQWIDRHNTGGYGEAIKSGKGLEYTVELRNRTPYIESIQTTKAIAQAAAYGLKNGFKRIAKIIDKEIEKANRAQ